MAEKPKKMKEVLGQFMDREVADEKAAEKLRQLGLDPSVTNAMGLSLVKRAVQGEVTAVRFLRDILEGEEKNDLLNKPVRALDLTKLTDEQLAALADREDGDGAG